ncbi:MAG: SpaA isopeptide-forming pilin-related protein [Actinomycetota bacterium]|nr:SpaA isopeptide-forming pilin-related protein [Actinomycetota bacterium]
MAGAYRVTETAHPAAFQAGGPWAGAVVAGQNARLVLTDQVTTTPVTVAKTGDNVAVQPIGTGVTFAVSYDATNAGSFTTTVGSWTTGPGRTTPAHNLAPGHYQLAEVAAPPGYHLAPPVTFSVAPVSPGGPAAQRVTVNDLAVRGSLSLRKTDADTGADIAGAVLRVSAGDHVVATFTTGTSPVSAPDLLAGRYTVNEVAAPPGYQLPVGADAGQVVNLAAGQALLVTVSDRRTPLRPAVASSPSVSAPLPLQTAPIGPSAPGPGAGALAFTGLPTWRLVSAGLLLVLAGGAVVAVGRRRSSR